MQLPQLTFLRFVAAMGVVMFHFHHGVRSMAWGSPLWSVANTAVSFFFFLSGFILTFVYEARGVNDRAEFYVARLARVAPLYLAALFGVASVEALGGRLAWDEALLSTLLLQAWLPGYSQVLNLPAWSLSVEWFFYLCFPFLLTRFSSVRSSRVLACAMALLWCEGMALHVGLVSTLRGHETDRAFVDFVYYHPLTHLPTFVLGMLGCLLFVRQRRALREKRAWLLGIAALGAVCVVLEPPALARYHHNGLFTPFYFCTIVGLASLDDHWLARALSLPSLVLLGEISYGVYILQGPLAMYVDRALLRVHASLSADAHFWLVVALLLAVSWLGYRQLEVPLRERVKVWMRRLRTLASDERASQGARLSQPPA